MPNLSCENEFYLLVTKNHSHINGFAISLPLKQRLRAKRRCPILLVGAKDVIRYSELLKSKITKLLERLQKLPFLGIVCIY